MHPCLVGVGETVISLCVDHVPLSWLWLLAILQRSDAHISLPKQPAQLLQSQAHGFFYAVNSSHFCCCCFIVMLKCLREGSIKNISILQKFRMSSNPFLFTSHYLTDSIFSILHHSTMANGDSIVLD